MIATAAATTTRAATLLLLLSAVAASAAAALERERYHSYWPSGIQAAGGKTDPDQDCAVAQLAYEYALQLQPGRAPLRPLFDALELGVKCGQQPPHPAPAAAAAAPAFAVSGEHVVYVDPSAGTNWNSGDVEAPLRTIGMALDRVRQRGAPSATVVLRAGVHFIDRTLEINATLSNLTIQNFPHEMAWISGGVALQVDWERVPPEDLPVVQGNLSNIWRASVALEAGAPGLNSLESDVDPQHARMVRARFPNRNVKGGSMERGLASASGTVWEKPPGWGKAGFNLSKSVWLTEPSGDEAAGSCGTHWTWGRGGWSCDRYTPAGGFWCSNQSSGGGSGWELMVPGAPLFPVALTVNTSVFTTAGVPSPLSWRNTSGAVVETWTNGWATTFWEVGDIRSAGGDGAGATFDFARGGQQTGRGFHIDPPDDITKPINTEGGWKIENALELLDAPEEFFYDEAASELYLNYNGSDSPGSRAWVVPQLKTLLRVSGTKEEPVRGVRIFGVGFRDTAYTYLDEWGIPSGGDWALHRGGAVFIEGAEDLVVDACEFYLLDGNALFLSGYTRNVTLANSSFAFIGDNAMAAWGYTRELNGSAEGLPHGVGIDGTGGEQPRFTSVLGNFVHDIGLNERQSSAWSEAKACLSTVRGNIFFQMPRAAININDGFGGGTVIEENLLTNTCRESGDHGPINSWDRQPYWTAVATGEPSLIPAYNVIRKNFLVSNYGAGFGVDNDDTSSYYRIYRNFFYLGGGIKCDYDGHEKRFFENLMLGTSAGCWHTCAYKKGYPDYCYNNTFVQAQQTPYAIIWFCDAKNVSHILPDYSNEVQMGHYIHSNKIFNNIGVATVTCGYFGPKNETTVPLSAFTDAGLMRDTQVGKTPSDAVVLQWARELLAIRLSNL